VRFAFLTSTPLTVTEGSGTFVGIDNLIDGLRTRGHQVDVRPLRLRTRFHTLDRCLYNVAAAITAPRVDVVVGFDLDGFLGAGRRAPRFVASLKGVIADELKNERGWVRTLLSCQARWEARNVARADRVLVPSEYSAGVVCREYGVAAGKVGVVPEAIDIERWRRRLAEARRRPAARPVVLAVGRMYPRKRFEDLLEAAVLLRRRIPDVEVRIVGNGPERAMLEARRLALDLHDTVRMLGDVTAGELATEYVSADCFCLPSVQEGFGIVFTEAMIAGLAIVACRAAAVPEVVTERTGVLVSPRRPDELASALATLLTDDRQRKELGEGGRVRVEEFARDRVADRFVQVAAA
jgi:glycosyltransferase involved in cell wall biosynthesis